MVLSYFYSIKGAPIHRCVESFGKTSTQRVPRRGMCELSQNHPTTSESQTLPPCVSQDGTGPVGLFMCEDRRFL